MFSGQNRWIRRWTILYEPSGWYWLPKKAAPHTWYWLWYTISYQWERKL